MGLQAANKFRVQSTKDCPQKSVVEIMVALKKKKITCTRKQSSGESIPDVLLDLDVIYN